jgi:hypothetical protein
MELNEFLVGLVDAFVYRMFIRRAYDVSISYRR